MSASKSLLPPKTPTPPSRDSTSALLDHNPPGDDDSRCDGDGNPCNENNDHAHPPPNPQTPSPETSAPNLANFTSLHNSDLLDSHGSYEWLVMPFGLTNALVAFHLSGRYPICLHLKGKTIVCKAQDSAWDGYTIDSTHAPSL
ncbi:hypothetical protein PAXRUDRAFT_9608 [Paxillus rubicundulus Ve08.2h10]|uniref:Uncharacterized protein n=1 Tax=Paxillus rubicundulus Ve08.2h10 TaxID=930991 RepID=A0A0D0DIW9_9AGAM|nr:hypothetical protein PAXRUDRAFT_9608 [Paxillus rubicundulus Ve08.2h10]